MSYQPIKRWIADNKATVSDFFCLSIVVPIMNEQENIFPFIAAVDKCLLNDLRFATPMMIEYVFVNDGSRDSSETVLREIAKRDSRVHLINLSRNFGKEAALSAGLSHASGHAIIPMDVDLQDPPSVLPEMIAHWLAGAKVVNAKRVDRSTDTRFKRWTSSLFYRVMNRLSDHDIPANVGDFRLLDREAVDVINGLTEHNRFNKGLFSWIGFQCATVEYVRPERTAGTTKWSIRKLSLLAIDGLTSSTTLPLRIWTGIGLLIAGLAFLYAIGLIAYTLSFGIETPGYASLMVITLFLGGLNLISLGVMGEYLGRIATQVRGRPLYIVDSKVGSNYGT